jgi:hypothetical protein
MPTHATGDPNPPDATPDTLLESAMMVELDMTISVGEPYAVIPTHATGEPPSLAAFRENTVTRAEDEATRVLLGILTVTRLPPPSVERPTPTPAAGEYMAAVLAVTVLPDVARMTALGIAMVIAAV